MTNVFFWTRSCSSEMKKNKRFSLDAFIQPFMFRENLLALTSSPKGISSQGKRRKMKQGCIFRILKSSFWSGAQNIEKRNFIFPLVRLHKSMFAYAEKSRDGRERKHIAPTHFPLLRNCYFSHNLPGINLHSSVEPGI